MNILLVYPEFADTFWLLRGLLKILSKKASFPPLGLLTIAAFLPKSWNVKLVDMNVGRLTDEDIRWADYVLVGGMITQKESVKQVIARCKKLGRKVVLGGPVLENGLDEFSDVSHFIVGEAEEAFPAFLSDLQSGNAEKVYAFQDKPDLASSPIPRWDLINPKDYVSAMVQYNRGCPWKCKFCSVAKINGRKLRAMSPEQFMREVEAIYAAGFSGPLFIASDNFSGNKKQAKEVLRLLAEWQKRRNYPFTITTEADITISDDSELMDLMVCAGFKQVFLGIETPIEANLIQWGKLQNTKRDLIACVKIIERHGLIPISGFIIGGDYDPADIAEQMIKFIQETGIVVAMISKLQAIPGTELYEQLEISGRSPRMPTGDNTDGDPNFDLLVPVGKLNRRCRKVERAIYSPKGLYETIRNLLKNYNPPTGPKKKLDFVDFQAFMRANLRIGLLGGPSASYYYWKTLLLALLKYPRSFSEAVGAQVYGAHFQERAKRF